MVDLAERCGMLRGMEGCRFLDEGLVERKKRRLAGLAAA